MWKCLHKKTKWEDTDREQKKGKYTQMPLLPTAEYNHFHIRIREMYF